MNATLLEETAQRVASLLQPARPRWAMILGSGWGMVAEAFTVTRSASYRDIPGLGGTQVEGHAGRLVLASHADHDLLIFQGRRHWYEGAGWDPVAIPIAICRAMGVSTLVLTNAAGGIRKGLKPGDLMVIDDHINGMGATPLVGPHATLWGPRFPDMSAVYTPELRDLFDQSAAKAGLTVQHGVYLATSGPSYETPAEVRAFRSLGADAVGMSTVPEAVLARAAGMRVAGLSCITNYAAGMAPSPLSHAEVIEETQRAQGRMRALLLGMFDLLVDSSPVRPAVVS